MARFFLGVTSWLLYNGARAASLPSFVLPLAAFVQGMCDQCLPGKLRPVLSTYTPLVEQFSCGQAVGVHQTTDRACAGDLGRRL